MANASSRRRVTRGPAAADRARSLAGRATKAANRITLSVLEGGKNSGAVKRIDPGPVGRKRRTKEKAAALATAPVAPIGLKADVSPKLIAAAPVFGDVLRSIAHAVAVTQTALDETALESLKTLAAQQVDVPVLVEQTLDENGIPTTAEIITASMPLTSIITPSMQQVDNMTLRMDMRVQSFNATSGIKFNQNMASAGVSYSGHSFGFAVGMSNTNVNAQFSNMSDFSSGSVMMSMDIVDRTGFQIPTPLEYGIGANLLVRLTSVNQVTTTLPGPPIITNITRTALLTVKQVTVAGAIVDNPNIAVTVPPGLSFTLSSGILTVTRAVATAVEPYLERKIYLQLGDLIKETSFYI